MAEKKKEDPAKDAEQAEKAAQKADKKSKYTTDSNAGPDADFGDGEYHAVHAPGRPEFKDVNK